MQRRKRQQCDYNKLGSTNKRNTPAAASVATAVAAPRKRRRRRADKATQADLYAALHARLPHSKTEEALSKQFSDKELRVLMKHNGMLINNYDQRTCSYIELTKAEKCRRIVAAVPTMIVPKRDADSMPRPPLHDPPARLNASAKTMHK